jgi:hypothetical protein
MPALFLREKLFLRWLRHRLLIAGIDIIHTFNDQEIEIKKAVKILEVLLWYLQPEELKISILICYYVTVAKIQQYMLRKV